MTRPGRATVAALCLSLCLWPGLAAAARLARAESGLPPPDLVERALNDAPMVAAAEARLAAAGAHARALRAGPYEFVAGGSYVSRTVDHLGRFDEFDATLSRGLRLPGKAALDRTAGALEIDVARKRYADIRRQAALTFATLWLDWLAAEADARIGAAATASYAASLAAVQRQVTLRDAALLDADQARAALATAAAGELAARGRAAAARARLAAQFPSFPLPVSAPAIAIPRLPPGGLRAWRDLVIARSDAIRGAAADAARFQVLAQRARQDRIPDPTVGVRAFRDRGGAERGVGVFVSIPLGGRYRRAQADMAVAETSVAQAQLGVVQRDIQAAADADLAAAEAGWRTWQAARAAASSTRRAVERLRAGRRLGAIDLTTLLYAQRLALDASRAESLARAELTRTILRLRINAYLLWVHPDPSPSP